ncbi:hypothetical protein SAMN04487949_0341 [Halogranum gelatinilyticum]|uniref:RecA-superfamily ATPase, KaiC/GvpD/RAD55 family n=1 Tax=Halogranum gelatinilyticum TaxID=660521 RepID=A0A1G9PD44_9EURY|nr:hypothetical protein SAMN04487949_0341 [Halogranum gelatinilyticum]
MTGLATHIPASDGHSALEDAASVLFLAPSISSQEDEVCTSLLRSDDAAQENLLWVSYTKSPDAQLRRWREHGHGQPANLGIVSVGESTRSAAASAGGGGSTAGPVESVASPNDLTGLGIRLNEYLHRWDGNDCQTRVCFDSLTAMLQYVDIETAYEFLHILTGRLYGVDAVAHFHMDPSAHDEQTVERIASLCDAVVDITGDDRVVRSR